MSESMAVADGQPDHSTIIAAVASLGAKFDSFKDETNRRLDKQDGALDKLMTAYNVNVGKGIVAKVVFAAIPGGLGAGIVKIVDWLQATPHTGTH